MRRHKIYTITILQTKNEFMGNIDWYCVNIDDKLSGWKTAAGFKDKKGIMDFLKREIKGVR